MPEKTGATVARARARAKPVAFPIHRIGERLALERDRELERIEDALKRAVDGDGVLIAVEGPAGIGKSLVLDLGAREAAERGFLVLSARAGELERTFPFGVVRQLFERYLLELSDSRREHLLSGAAGLSAPAVGTPTRVAAPPVDAWFSVIHGLYWLAVNVAAEQPLALVVDDFHWADPPSLRFLLYLAARLEGLPLVVLAAARPHEPGAATELSGRLLGWTPAITLRPAPLSVDATGALVEARLGGGGEAEFHAACQRASGGNPFVLEELLRALQADGVHAWTARKEQVEGLGPHTIARSLLMRLGRMSRAAATLARAVAVLGARADLRHAAALAGLSTEEARAAADALVRIEVLRPELPLAFVHPAVRESIYQDLAPSERAALHGRAVPLLAEAGALPAQLAQHLLATEPAGDAAVVTWLRTAAGDALSQGAPDLAQRYLVRALGEPPTPELAPDVLSELGGAEWLAGEAPHQAVEHLAMALELTPDPARRPPRVLALARAMFSAGQLSQAIDLLEREISALEGNADPEDLLRIEAELACLGLLHPDTVHRTRERLKRFEDLEGRTPTELLQVANVASWKWTAGTAAETASIGERSLADARLQAADEADSVPIYETLMALIYADCHELALSVLDDTLADARSRGSIFGVSTSCALRSLSALRRGDIAVAEAEARAAIGFPGLSAFVRPPLFGYLTLALIARGALDEAEWAIVESGCGPDIPEFVCLNPVFYSRGVLRLAQGRPEEGLADLYELGERSRRVDFRNPGDPWRLAAIPPLLDLGREAEARRLAEEQYELASVWGTKSAIGAALHGRAMAYGGDTERLSEAVAVLVGSPARLDHAAALVDLGASLRRSNQRVKAREPLFAALELARRLGATVLARRAHNELVRAGARPRRLMFSGVEALTPTERQVAELAASGQSNRQIAQTLFVTPKTVENHLGRIYTKLQIHSREELSGALAVDS